jgi:outer membrane protein OmpA-like peptidoglycan-associated protein
MKQTLLCLAALLAATASFAEDAEGSKDHPLFKRMPGFQIQAYTQSGFDSIDFALDKDGEKSQKVEGKTTKISYSVPGDEHPSIVQVLRNHASAIKAIGGQTVMQSDNEATYKLVKPGKETWASVSVSNEGGYYDLVIVEKGAMKQEISSSDMREALERDGHVALDIHFDTGKATIKPDSQAIVAQIVKLLQEDAELSLKVEGHTDNVGDAKANLALSKARAKSVVAALTAQSIEAKRLQDDGFGMTKPVADNATAEGRAKNRRVELVKR